MFDEFFRSAPGEIRVEAIRREWLALTPRYRIDARRPPAPVWARRGFTETGRQAWSTLGEQLTHTTMPRPYCIYIHIPFCATKCGFCDCYSFRLGQHQAQHIERYIDTLEQEMRLWGQFNSLSQRRVSTVHLGGGTPTFLNVDAFTRLVQSCRTCFATDAQTEWALESTTSELGDEMFEVVHKLGFTRLHIGVQSLEPHVRQGIGRREPATAVLEKISHALTLDWIVSVDLILGLPQQSLTGLVHDIEVLAHAGVDGFSLYELQTSPRNQKFLTRHAPGSTDRASHYFIFQAASQRLASLGYRKTLFNHWARARDTNLYFTFPERDEDCLALGTIADGVLGDYHYRHPRYAEYCNTVDGAFPGLEAGLRRNGLENHVQPLEVAILSGKLQLRRFQEILGTRQAEALFERWKQASLIEERAPCFVLTANGSWFAGEMMAQLVE